MALKPLYDRVVVRRLEAETTTKAGIIIPDKSAEKPTQGEVIAVGEGAICESGEVRALAVRPGDRILFGQYAGTKTKVDGEELLIMKESDILAIVEVEQAEEKAA
ncbi:co-chaperone GroES [Neiella sp. HB171785]|uniref:Co-chaperonin GroES n=1 Tax=Neiella litorisoli TaxID=2771431 RepID=A0A8J6UDZ9_9GAMM|nr:co-chaperone GroES [Neiella litorisoli]MBD1388949.1 co-chaperone GroES [Neiella litorisoli]